MINNIVIFDHLSRCRVRGHLHLIFGDTEAAQHHSQQEPLLFHCSPKLFSNIGYDFSDHTKPSIFSHYTRMHLGKSFWRYIVSEQCITLRFHISYSVSQFLDRSSNLKAGCKKNAFYIIAFDAIYVSCIHDSSSNFFHPRLVMTCTIVCSLPPEPAYTRDLVLVLLVIQHYLSLAIRNMPTPLYPGSRMRYIIVLATPLISSSFN